MTDDQADIIDVLDGSGPNYPTYRVVSSQPLNYQPMDRADYGHSQSRWVRRGVDAATILQSRPRRRHDGHGHAWFSGFQGLFTPYPQCVRVEGVISTTWLNLCLAAQPLKVKSF